MNDKRESPQTDLGFIVLGLVIVLFALLRLGSTIEYLPNDPRAQPWFNPLITAIGVAVGIITVLVGAIRLWQWRRNRKS